MLGIVLPTQIYDIGASGVRPVGVGAELQVLGMGLILITVTALSVRSRFPSSAWSPYPPAPGLLLAHHARPPDDRMSAAGRFKTAR